MVRNYQKKTTRGSWSLSSVHSAVEAVQKGELSLREASAVYNVPKSTLERHKNNKVEKPGSLGRFQPVLDNDFERELVGYCIEMQQRMFGLTMKELQSLAFQLAEMNHMPHRYNTETKLAGRDWVEQFLKRNPELSLRAPEPTSLCRVVGFNKVQIDRFFDILQSMYDKYQLQPARIWNVDESGLTSVHKPGKVISLKGQRQVGKITSGERGKTVTIVCAVSACGSYVPPMIVFPRIKMNDRLLHGAPPGTVGFPSKSGWMDQNLFVKWLEHFAQCVRPSPEEPHLLLLDGHISHKSLPAVELARKKGIIMVSFPPHCTHRIQPLDVVMYGPLKTYYNQACDRWMMHHPGKRISDYEIAGLFNTAYVKAATIDKGPVGFQCTGIYPFNPDIFKNTDFAPSSVTDNSISVVQHVVSVPHNWHDVILPQPEVGQEIHIVLATDEHGGSLEDQSVNNQSVSAIATSNNMASEETADDGDQSATNHFASTITADNNVATNEAADEDDLPTSPPRIHIAEISPFPVCNTVERRKRKAQRAEVLTSSPYKKLLEDKERPKEAQKKKQLKKQERAGKKKKQLKPRGPRPRPKSTGVGPNRKASSRNRDEDGEHDLMIPCGSCGGTFESDRKSRNGKRWIQCRECTVWYHNDCQGLDHKGDNNFRCISCEDD